MVSGFSHSPGVGDRGQRVADHPAAGHLGGHLLGLLREGVADRDHPDPGDAAVQPGHVVGAHHADAEHGHPQLTGRDVGQLREHAGGGLRGGHACCSERVVAAPISSEAMPQPAM
jgi:hypothetical protein